MENIKKEYKIVCRDKVFQMSFPEINFCNIGKVVWATKEIKDFYQTEDQKISFVSHIHVCDIGEIIDLFRFFGINQDLAVNFVVCYADKGRLCCDFIEENQARLQMMKQSHKDTLKKIITLKAWKKIDWDGFTILN